MKKVIWKFELETTDKQRIKIPLGAEILTIQTQDGVPCIWALVNPDNTNEDIFIEIFGTGHEINYGMGADRKYLGTYQLGSLVFHVFEYLGV